MNELEKLMGTIKNRIGINRITAIDDKSNLRPRKIIWTNSKKCKLVNKSG